MADLKYYDAKETASLIDYYQLREELEKVAIDYTDGLIDCPSRQVIKIPNSKEGLLLSMPSTADGICVHKLLTLLPENHNANRPMIQGVVSVMDSKTGEPLFFLDAVTITALRTATVSMLGIKTFLQKEPERIVIVGAGGQAHGHVKAIAKLYPQASIYIVGRAHNKEQIWAFCESYENIPNAVIPCSLDSLPEDFDVLITVTTAKEPFYHFPAIPGRLIIGVGAFQADMAEIAEQTVIDSLCFIDDSVGGKHEAGDYIRANKDWSQVRSLASAIKEGVDFNQPIMFKSVGSAAWDLAAARVAYTKLSKAQS